MGFLGSKWTAQLRTLVGLAHGSTLVVLRRSMSPNQIGGVRDVWEEVSRVPGRLTRLRQLDYFAFHGNEQISISSWGAFTDPSADIRVGDRIRVLARTFQVVGSDAGRTSALTQLVRLIEEQ